MIMMVKNEKAMTKFVLYLFSQTGYKFLILTTGVMTGISFVKTFSAHNGNF